MDDCISLSSLSGILKASMGTENECTMNKAPKCRQDREKKTDQGVGFVIYGALITNYLAACSAIRTALGLFIHMATPR